MSIWTVLDAELDAWADAQQVATLWWRDDDAVCETPALTRLCSTASENGVGLCIAMIPVGVDAALLERYQWPDGVTILQHGCTHRNHAPAGEKKSELHGSRPLKEVMDDIEQGWAIISRSSNAIAAFVPPWNRISDCVVGILADHGFRGISTFGPRKQINPVKGLHQTNTHVDPIDWRDSRGYVGDDAAVGQIVRHLSNRRVGEVDPMEPTGILTHHLVHDDGCWQFVERVATIIANHPSARWLRGDEVFAT